MNDVLEKLPELSPDDLRKVVSAANFLLAPVGGGPAGNANPSNPSNPDPAVAVAPSTVDEIDSAIGGELEEVLRSRGEKPLPIGILLKTRTGALYRRGAATVHEYVESSFHPQTRRDTIRIVRRLMGLMVKELTLQGVPVCARTVCGKMTRVAQVVDRAFPGYHAAGLLPLVFARSTTRTPSVEE